MAKKKKDKKGAAEAVEGVEAAPAKVRKKGPGLVDRLTVLVAGLFLLSTALPHLLA